MLTDAQRQFIAAATRTMQIIVGALAFGVASFFIIVLVIPADANAGGKTLSTMAVVAGAAAIVLATAIGATLVRTQIAAIAAGRYKLSRHISQMAGAETGDAAALVAVYQTHLIVRAAILDGAAFFALIAYMLERQSSSLAAAAALLLFILFLLPTRGRVESWVQNQLANVEQLRQLGTG